MQSQQTPKTRQPANLSEQQIDRLMEEVREIFKDQPEYVKKAVEGLRSDIEIVPETLMETAGRVGAKQGQLS